jgi:nucleoside-diphosphate-sugar epimerase
MSVGYQASTRGSMKSRPAPEHVAQAFLLAALCQTLPSRIYNLGGPAALSLLEIATIASAAANAPSPQLYPFPPEQLPIDIGDYQADTRRIRSELGWLPQCYFQKGISLTPKAYDIAVTRIKERSVCGGF